MPDATPPVPGLILVWSAGKPVMVPIPLLNGEITVGRESTGGTPLEDSRVSRRHAEVSLRDGKWSVLDLDSRNGTFLDGERLKRLVSRPSPTILRVGHTMFLLRHDITPLQNTSVQARGEIVMGPKLKAAWAQIAEAAKAGGTLYLTGESGTGKEVAAREFHATGMTPEGPFEVVNCARIPEGTAERSLFGVRKGSRSGALEDAPGHLENADGGTLFLDDVSELDPSVQAKLLQALETRQVLAVGATRPRSVNIRVVSASRKDLRKEVASGRFREDLFKRIATPEVTLPPLRDRPEEIAYLVRREVQKVRSTMAVHYSIVETCLLRRWPGNVRELTQEVYRAALNGMQGGIERIGSRQLSPEAGLGESEPTGVISLP